VGFSLYSPNPYQKERRIVALYRNRRSHGNIIAWSNRYFYEDTMRDYGNSYITFHLVHSDVLPKKGFPVVFHGVKGSEQHVEWSPSYFNIIEASIVRDYCVKLTGDTERKICEYETIFWFYLHFLLFSST
jgi:helicase MOV-10